MSPTSRHIQRLLKIPQQSISMKQLYTMGQSVLMPPNPQSTKNMTAMLQFGEMLHKEMPVRFAHRINDLEQLPHNVGQMPSIRNVQTWYEDSMLELLDIPQVVTKEDDQQLLRVLNRIYERHADTLVVVAKGLTEFVQSEYGKQTLALENKSSLAELVELHEFLDRFFISRIGIRILIGHYLELHQPERHEGYVGLICEATSPADVATQAAEDAKYMCERHYGMAPDVELVGRTDLTFPYVPSHLYYILFELLKNSMRAVTETHLASGEVAGLPDIRVVVADGEHNEDVVIKISDLGGGIPRSITSKIFSYLFTTAHPVSTYDDMDLHDFGRENPLAGLGYGLPIARSYARYFGGDLNLISMEGYGTDSFVHLSRVMDKEEPLA